MQLPARKDQLTLGGALLVAALAGGAVAVGLSSLIGVGNETATVREIVHEPAPPNQISQGGKSMTLGQIYKEDSPGVVQVTSTVKVQLPRNQFFGNPFLPGTEIQQSLGSGFVIDKAGHVVTNYHVVEHAQSVQVSFSNNEAMTATIVGRDPSTDVALLRVQASSRALKPVPMGNSDDVQVGDQVAAIGNPLGYDRSITFGIVSALHRTLTSPAGGTIDRVIQTDAALNHGNSGGPLLNAQGEVIGISSAISTGDTGGGGIGFAIPINAVKDVVAQLKSKGRVEHPFIGVVTLAINGRIAKVFNLAAPGLLVERVYPGSGAEKAGLVAGNDQVTFEGESYLLGGDLIVKVEGVRVTSAEGLREIVSEHKPGDTLDIEFYRGSDLQTAAVKLGRQSPLPLE